MKKLYLFIATLTLCLSANGQERKDFFTFADSFDWNLSGSEIEKKYSSRILPKEDSLYQTYEEVNSYKYILDEHKIGEYACKTIILGLKFDEDNNEQPCVLAEVSKEAFGALLPSQAILILDNYFEKRFGTPDLIIPKEKLSEYEGLKAITEINGSLSIWNLPNFLCVVAKGTSEDGLFYRICTLANDLKNIPIQRPAIQSKFFGLSIGNLVTVNQIKAAVGNNGTFHKEELTSSGNYVSFLNIIFAGEKWDFGNFVISSTSRFWFFSVYKSYNDGYPYSNEKRDAQNLYDTLKQKLSAKYGDAQEQTDTNGDKSLYYFGSNNVVAILSNEIARSVGGDYRRYVKLTYLDQAIMKTIGDASDSQL